MIGELSIGGVFLPTLLVIAVVSFVVSLVLRMFIRRLRLYRYVWHAGLFDVATFIVIVWLVSMLTAQLEPYGFT
jgi:Protein of unknown function (DUF1656)